jgi:acetolactate synthase-1/2/3 large subunit
VSCPSELDDAIAQCLAHDGPFLLDVRVVARGELLSDDAGGCGHQQIMLSETEWYSG